MKHGYRTNIEPESTKNRAYQWVIDTGSDGFKLSMRTTNRPDLSAQ